MNKYQEALDKIADELIECGRTKDLNGETILKEQTELNLLQELVDKAILKKPNIWGDGYDDKGQLIYDMYDCPNCDKTYELDYEKYDYCPKCGQAIKWSDENE